MNSYERVMNTLAGEPRDRVPLSLMMMAWAGHYAGHTYRDYCLNMDALVGSHLAMVRDFGMDTVTVQTDPWVEAEAYGMTFDYPDEGVGIPQGHLLEDGFDLDQIKTFDPHEHKRTSDRIRAIRMYAQQVKDEVPIIGWVEGPIAEYADLRGLEMASIDLIEQPDKIAQAFDIIVDNALRFAKAQIEAGADIVGVGDAAASIMGPHLYESIIVPAERKLFQGIRDAGGKVKVHICGDIRTLLPGLSTLPIDILDIDWMVPLKHAHDVMGEQVTLCGNFDPVASLLKCTPEQAAAAAQRCVEEAGDRFILQAGCETPPGTPEANVRAVCGCCTASA